MEVSTEPLCQALRSAQSSPDVLIKLAKKNDFAVLTFDVQAVVSYSDLKPICSNVKHCPRATKAKPFKSLTMFASMSCARTRLTNCRSHSAQNQM